MICFVAYCFQNNTSILAILAEGVNWGRTLIHPLFDVIRPSQETNFA